MRVRRQRDGDVEVVVEEHEAGVLSTLADQLVELVKGDEGAVRDRLYPRAYLDPTEDAAEQEWQRLMHADLVAAKEGALRELVAGLAAGERRGDRIRLVLDDEQVAAWLGALNDARLALGVMLDVTEDLDLAAVPDDDPRAPSYHLYGWLTWLQDEMVRAAGG